ncbi:MAG: protein kinase [Acidobacteriota bacterium]
MSSSNVMKECPACSHCFDDNFAICPTDGKTLDFSWPGSRTILDKYRLDAVIGKGGMGVVYRATQIELVRQVAVKVLSPQFLTNEEATKRFRTEALAAARLDHPNIITIYDYGTLPGGAGAYLVMKLLRGHALTKEILQVGQLSFDRILTIMQQVCAGVATAHQGRIVHCDLKPDNIFLETTEGNQEIVQIVDFGIARLREISGTGSLHSVHTGGVVGTPYYMSPEQCLGEKIYFHSDIYSLGIILYEMLTGTVPFKSANAADVALQHIRSEPLPPSSLRRDIGAVLDKVVLKALAKRSEDRFQTVLAFADDLKAAIEQTKATLDQLPRALRGRRRDRRTTMGFSETDKNEARQTKIGFINTMPLADARPSQPETSSASEELKYPQINVLLVDDEPGIVAILESIFEPFGCQIMTAHDGDEAWHKLKEKRPHLIISDIMMPNVDGWQLFFRYKTDGTLDDIPFIFVTARDSWEEKVMALEQGVEDYWTKPFVIAELTVRIKRLLQRISNRTPR